MEDKLRTFLNERFPGKVLGEYSHRGQHSFYVEPSSIRDIAVALKDDPELEFTFLTDVCSVDHLGRPWEKDGRFEVIYILTSLKLNYRFMLRVRIKDDSVRIPTLSHDWNTANWLEREVWDMMGIVFEGHEDLTKIVTDDELEGHPLRKDFGIVYEIPQFSHNKHDVEVVPNNPNH